jgi:hypothetical protein
MIGEPGLPNSFAGHGFARASGIRGGLRLRQIALILLDFWTFLTASPRHGLETALSVFDSPVYYPPRIELRRGGIQDQRVSGPGARRRGGGK